MARKTIDIGTVGNDGTGDSIRDSFRKVNDNFRELYSSLGLGEKLRFISLDDTPATYVGQEDAILAVNATTDGLKFKQVVAGQGIFIDQSTNNNEIKINAEFAEISSDPSPQLGGDLSAQSGGQQHRIQDLTTPITSDEAVNKAYADTKIALGGVDAVDPATGTSNSAFGRMSGPLILSRSPEDDDDEVYDGLIAATKSYVDSSGFGSSVNLYVATSGSDDRSNLAENLQGRSLASAFRTIERACKRAEELVLDSKLEIGPYKKLLTYNDGDEICTLAKTETSPDSGTGFVGSVTMSVDSVTIVNGGTNYLPGDILEITGTGGAGSFARVEVLSTASTPGAILTFRVLTNGVYTALPGDTNVSTSSNSEFGQGALFDVTYKVNTVSIENAGSGYALVSVRITGGGGSGAFGTATVVGGEITNIDITDQGQGFTSVPTVEVDLPRFFIETGGNRTDFTGDVETDTIDAARGRDIREGLFLRGETSGALAQILAHDGSLDSEGNEIFDVDVKFGSFQIGEPIAYGDRAKEVQICIFVEAGIYEEHLPLKLPANTAIIGDEFRRTLLRPKPGTSSSPWAFQKFRRDTVIDGLTTSTQIYGHHYLHDSTQPVYPKIDNPGGFLDAAQLLKLNRQFIQKETIAWINEQIATNTSPFSSSFNYNQSLCERDIGLLLDSMIFDLKYGEYNRTISAGLKYFESASGRVAITEQLSETIAGIRKVEELAVDVVNNTAVTSLEQESFRQIVDPAFSALSAADTVLADLFNAVVDVIDNSGSVNYPEENDKLDVFLCNDANIIRAITCQGQGGFMMVLDPQGQILAKSPYCQESASFSKSTGLQTFSGGMFVDGFTGNLQFTHEFSTSSTRIGVSGLDRFPELPASFIVSDQVFRVNYVRDFVFDKDGSSATLVIDETTPFTLSPGAQSCTISTGSPAIITNPDHGLQAGATVRFTVSEGGSLPGGIEANRDYYVLGGGLTANTFRVTETFGSITEVETTDAGSGTFQYQRVYEILMPGNRSMLSNDFTQVNDMGYGLLATNGGLTEAVSMFTYYCYTSYYSLNGAQIRSIGGSSAHGVYALVAEGADPLEIPTPTELYYDLAQRVDCYFPSPSFANQTNGLIIYVTNYSYLPLGLSELEIDHGNRIFRYPVTSVAVDGLPDGVAVLNLTSDDTGNFDGLFDQVPNDTKMTLRSGAKIVLTGGLEDVAVRPSTGLVLNETDQVYRVLQFETSDDELVPVYEVAPTVADPAEFSVVLEITDIDGSTETCTFSQNHFLRRGDTFVPDSSANGFTAGQTYYVIDVPNYDEAIFSTTEGGSAVNLSTLAGGSIKGVVPHKLQAGFTVAFTTTGSYPAGLDGSDYFVLEDGFTETTFQISKLQTGNPIPITNSGTGTLSYSQTGLTTTTLRENYNYNDLTLYVPGEIVAGTETNCTISIASPAVVTTVGAHGLSQGDAITFNTTGTLPTGMSNLENYFVYNVVSGTEFQISSEHPTISSSVAVDTSGTQSGTQSFGLIQGRVGDDNVPVVPVAPQDESRIPGSRFVFKGEEYVIDTYENTTATGEVYARLTFNRPLEDSIIEYGAVYSIKSAIPVRSIGAVGTLTIRISLTRVTSHDLLEIGTGSYADTNYPNEIYGSPVNAPDPANEVVERDVGRCFFVTTDQFGNFRVGPFFTVDQGTGRVTFSAAIALSNLDGIGFKRGVPISEFSVDPTMADNAVDTVPTENAVRNYIDKRLGLTHNAVPLTQDAIIPPDTGGFMALDGQLSMKANMNLDDNKIVNLEDATNPQDAVNLRSLTVDNFQNFTVTDAKANNIIVFTGDGNEVQNAEVVGDIAFDIDSTANTIDAQINPGVILNADVNSSAGIEQSKLSMNAATTRANATGITQADRGLASFNSAEFDADNGWISLKDNGTPLESIQQITTKTVLGNSTLTTNNVTEVPFSTVVSDGGSIKKLQFDQVGFLRRLNTGSFTADGDYEVVNSSSAYTGAADNDKIITRDSNGDFGARIADINQLKVDGDLVLDSSVVSSGGFIQLYAYNEQGGILLQTGSVAQDNVTQYRNNLHQFSTLDGNNDAPISCSQIETLSLTTGGQAVAGSVTGNWSLVGSSKFEATYAADLAEYYEGDSEYEPGTVLVFGGDKEVTKSNIKQDTRVAGVVSDNAAYVMYGACPGLKNLVALQGRVPCKVVGKIKKGDLLTTSGIPGVAGTVSGTPITGTIIGKALQEYDSDHIGTIEVAVGRS